MKQPAALDPEPYLPLRPNWFHIMAVLADGEQHGYAIMQQVQERTSGKVRLWPATLYGAIKKLLDEELIIELSERPDAAPAAWAVVPASAEAGGRVGGGVGGHRFQPFAFSRL